MHRQGNLYSKIWDMNNLILANKKARRGKENRTEIKEFDKNVVQNLINLQTLLKSNTYKTSPYQTFWLSDPKERQIFRLPYFPDRIVHHATMNILEDIIVSCFISTTFNCIKGRGIHKALYSVREALLSGRDNTKYCLKLDVQKFYPSVDNTILKKLLRRKIKDQELLYFLDEIIDSTQGLPIGNYLSQYLANFYLTYFDHWIKQDLKTKYYFRYCDDLVILGETKKELHEKLALIRVYLYNNLNLKLKSNYQVFPVEDRGIDFVGYRIFYNYILLRKRIKNNFIKMIKYYPNKKSIDSYNGWLSHCNSKTLKNKYLS